MRVRVWVGICYIKSTLNSNKESSTSASSVLVDRSSGKFWLGL